MSRLIDADVLIEEMKKEQESGKYDENTIIVSDCFIGILNRQPTAYSIEKLIGRLEEQQAEAENEMHRLRSGDYTLPCSYDITDIKEIVSESFKESIEIVNELAEEYRNDKVCQTAIMYAKNLHKYGVQIDSIWETATQQSMALNQAYMRGRQDERDIFDEWQEKHINTSTDTSSGYCEWQPIDEEKSIYKSVCKKQSLYDGNPIESMYEFCPYCGKKIKVEGVKEND